MKTNLNKYKVREDMSVQEFLASRTSRQLVSWMQNCRLYEQSGEEYVIREPVKGGAFIDFTLTRELLKEELTKRPHVPNKNESRGLRMQKIRRGR